MIGNITQNLINTIEYFLDLMSTSMKQFICNTFFGEYFSYFSSLVTIKSRDEQKFVYSLSLKIVEK
jgi:hypothetical protein